MERTVEGDVVNIKAGLLQAATIVLQKAKFYVPKETGNLEKSGRIVGNEVGGVGSRYTVEFGGPGATYAAFVHEMLEIPHEPPTCAKYLLRAVHETRDQQVAAVKRAIQIRNMHTNEVIQGTGIKYRWTEYPEFKYVGSSGPTPFTPFEGTL
jgi:hypothetical protein